jgi:Tol biopolymer transport system component
VLAAGTLGWWLLSDRRATPPTAPPRITPFTSDGGFKIYPQLSPDSEKVAYSWAGPADDNWDIYVKALGLGSKPLRLTEDPANDWGPVWSPDERQIAFVRWTDEAAAIYTVPSLGGQERKLIDIRGQVFMDYWVPALSWSLKGEWLFFGEKATASEPSRIVRLSLEALERQPLTSPPDDSLGDLYPSLSPDGTQLAFVRAGSRPGMDQDVWVQPLPGGEPRRVTFGEYVHCSGLSWTADGGDVLFAALEGTSWGILRASLAGGDPQPILGVGRNTGDPSVRGDRMVYVQRTAPPADIWRIPGRGSPSTDRVPEKVISSSGVDVCPAYSPDGRKIAFCSSRGGPTNIWVSDSDGSHPIQLTDSAGWSGTPRWSPDSRRLVFDSWEAGDVNLYLIDADGGVPRRLTQEPSSDGTASWSRDGRWIYFGSDRSGSPQIWKIPAEGGEAVQVTRGGGFYAEESWDGRHLYYSPTPPRTGIWRVAVEGGDETEAVQGHMGFGDWTLSRSGLYYATRERILVRRTSEYTIRFLDFESGQVMDLFRKKGPFRHGFLAVSPDEEWLLYDEAPAPQSELMLVENFR